MLLRYIKFINLVGGSMVQYTVFKSTNLQELQNGLDDGINVAANVCTVEKY